MNRQELDDANRTAVQRNYRAIEDADGRIPQQLLDDLAAVAEQHVKDVTPAESAPPQNLHPANTAPPPRRSRRTTDQSSVA